MLPLLCVNSVNSVNILGFSAVGSLSGEDFPYDYASLISQINMTNIREHIFRLSNLGSRVTGYPGFYEAAEYIKEKFLEYGLSNVHFEYFDVTVPIDYGANLTVISPEKRFIKAYPLWPNLVVTCAVPPEGIVAPLVYVGSGEPHEFNGKNVNGSIILMEFNSRRNWKYAAMFGARAVVFIEPREDCLSFEAEQKYIELPIYFPRLYISRSDGDYLINLLKKGKVIARLKSNMQYEVVKAPNIVGYLNGTDPNLSDELIGIVSNYDSISVVPSLSPGAEEAVGIASLLEIARILNQNPPRRPIMFVAFAGKNFALAGSRAFFEKHFTEVGTKIRLVIDLKLQTKSDFLGIAYSGLFYYNFHGGTERFLWFSRRIRETYAEYYDSLNHKIKLRGLNKTYEVFDALLSKRELTKYFSDIERYIFDGEVFTAAGGVGITLYSCGENLCWKTPSDTFDKLDFENLRPQVEFSLCLIYSLINEEEFPPEILQLRPIRAKEGQSGFLTLTGKVLQYDPSKGFWTPVPHALVYIQGSTGVVACVRNVQKFIIKADENGTYTLYGCEWAWWEKNPVYTIYGFVVQPYGPISAAPDLGKYGEKEVGFIKLRFTGIHPEIRNTVVTNCSSIVLWDFIKQSNLAPFEDPEIVIYEFPSHSLPVEEGYGWLTQPYETEAVIWHAPNIPFEIRIGTVADPNPYIILINASDVYPEGTGYRLSHGQQIFLTPTDYAQNLFYLDDARLTKCREHSIIIKHVEDVHADTKKLLANAINALHEKKYDAYYLASINAWSKERVVYRNTRNTMYNAINTVIFFALLMVPFSVLMERFLFETTSSLRRLVYIGLIFSIFILILYFMHPGLHMSYSVFMAIFGFALTCFIALIIVILLSRTTLIFRELRPISTVHYAEISRVSAIFMSFSLGISQLKRRRLRTIFNMLTVICIVFTLVTFSSVSLAITPKEIERTGITEYPGVMIKRDRWLPFSDEFLTYIKIAYANEAVIAPRAWLYHQLRSRSLPGEEAWRQFTTIWLHSTDGIASVWAIAGFVPEEAEVTGINRTLIKGRWFVPGDFYSCIISNLTASQLGISDVPAEIWFYGIRLRVVGIFDSKMLNNLTDLDQYVLTPIDFTYEQSLKHYGAEDVLIVPFDFARKLGAYVYTLALKFKDPAAVWEATSELSSYLRDTIIYAGLNGVIRIFMPGAKVAVTGLEPLPIIVVIGMLTLIDTMLGNIHERKREISTLSCVGLSPMHIAGFYLAESLIFGLLGSVIGYMMSIGTINILLRLGLIPATVSLNFTSEWTMVAVGFSVLIVTASTIYPMFLSAKLVTPSIERVWRIPTKPKGNEWVIPLPFVSPPEETTGILNFLEEYLKGYTLEEKGLFRVSEMKRYEILEKDREIKAISATVMLAPFEAGVSQDVHIRAFRPKGEKNYTFEIYLRQKTGMRSVWVHANRHFTNVIRKQMLVWRSLKPEDKKPYMKGEVR